MFDPTLMMKLGNANNVTSSNYQEDNELNILNKKTEKQGNTGNITSRKPQMKILNPNIFDPKPHKNKSQKQKNR